MSVLRVPSSSGQGDSSSQQEVSVRETKATGRRRERRQRTRGSAMKSHATGRGARTPADTAVVCNVELAWWTCVLIPEHCSISHVTTVIANLCSHHPLGSSFHGNPDEADVDLRKYYDVGGVQLVRNMETAFKELEGQKAQLDSQLNQVPKNHPQRKAFEAQVEQQKRQFEKSRAKPEIEGLDVRENSEVWLMFSFVWPPQARCAVMTLRSWCPFPPRNGVVSSCIMKYLFCLVILGRDKSRDSDRASQRPGDESASRSLLKRACHHVSSS